MILQKLKEARAIIKNSDLKKVGRNTFSNYDYYTPEQVEKLVDGACEETNTIILCNLEADEYGLFQVLEFIDLDKPEEKLVFKMRTKNGIIKATNEAQQMGGTDTYSERYIKMKVFLIKDNSLDIDSKDMRENTKAPIEKEVIKKEVSNENLILAEVLLKECKNLEELGKVWNELSYETKINKDILSIKNELKNILV